MSTIFPSNTIAMIIVVMFAVGISSWFIISQGIKRLSLTPSIQLKWRWGAAVLLSLWLLALLALAFFPLRGNLIRTQFVVTFAFATVGLLVGVIALLVSPVLRQIVRTIPQTWLIGVHSIRLEGFLFVALVDIRLLPPTFGLSAGYGDMVAGLLALGVVFLLLQRKPGTQLAVSQRDQAFIIAWNIYGLLDLINALITGAILIGPFAARMAASGIPINYLNFVLLIPAFGVPVLALLHLFSLYQILSVRLGQREQEKLHSQIQAPAK